MLNLTVYYNSKCPVCDSGISYQRRQLAKEGIIEWRDINLEPKALERFNIGVDDVRKRLTAVDMNGTLLVGIKTFAAIWKLTPGQEWLGKIIVLPVIYHVSHVLYEILAELLYKWNKFKNNW